MKLFTIFNPLTVDNILRNGICQDSEINNQAKTGEACLPNVRGDSLTQQVENIAGIWTLVNK